MKVEPTTARGVASVERIILAACELFASQGVRSTTLQQVGQRSDTGRGQLYFYFEDKSDLLRDVIDFLFDQLLNAQQTHLDTMESALDVRKWCVAAADQYRGVDAMRCPVGSLVYELSADESEARERIRKGFERWHKALVVGMKRVHKAGGLVPGLKPSDAATAFLTTYEGAVLIANATGDASALRKALLSLADMALVSRSS